MKINSFDLSLYLQTRSEMQLLPNLLDFGMAYAAFRPLLRFDAVLKPFLHSFEVLDGSYGKSLEPFLVQLLESNPLQFGAYAGLYLLFAFIYGLVMIIFAGWIKSMVLSDNQPTIRIILGLFTIFTLIVFGVFMALGSLLFAFIAGIFPVLYIVGSRTYLKKLRALKANPDFGVLTGLRTRMFTYSTVRYRLFSWSSFKVYCSLIYNFKEIFLYYIALGLFILAIRLSLLTDLSLSFKNWVAALNTLPRFTVYILGFFLLSQIIARTRKSISNKATDIWYEIRSRLAHSVSVLAQKDNRPPILLLRSFQDDKIVVKNNRQLGSKFLGIQNHDIRLEETMADTLYPYGPLIALSNPKDDLPTIGAAKENITDDAWQALVKSYMKQSARIVLIVGTTPSFRWEVQEIISKGYINKSIFVFPPAYRSTESEERLLINCQTELAEFLGIKNKRAEEKHFSDALVFGKNKAGKYYAVKATGEIKANAYSEALRWLFEKTTS